MQTSERFSSLIDSLDARSRGSRQHLLEQFIRGLVHDLNNPLGTFSMEVFMIRKTIDMLLDRILEGDLIGVNKQAQRLNDICDNLELSIEEVGRLTDLLERLGRE